MFFFFPIATDAPVYHWPYATVGLIAANVLVFIGMAAGEIDPLSGWLLAHGDGLHPLQWLLSMFAHAGIGHLIGNMVFLWVFGLVVEGKLGWWRFLVCYLGIGVGQSAFEQVAMLGLAGPSFSLGASSAIYGIMAMAAVWAPKNEVSFFYFLWCFSVFTGTYEIAIGWVAAFYVGLDLLWVVLSAGQMSSSWLHVTGVMVGLPLGIALLKSGLVDCEGWDMFHIWKGDPGAVKEKRLAVEQAAADAAERRELATRSQQIEGRERLRAYLAVGNAVAAFTLIGKLREAGAPLTLESDELKALIGGLHKASRFADSAPFMAELIERDPGSADLVRLKLAQICVMELNRPGRALDLLAEIDTGALAAKHRSLADKIQRKAQQMQHEGVVEMDDESW